MMHKKFLLLMTKKIFGGFLRRLLKKSGARGSLRRLFKKRGAAFAPKRSVIIALLGGLSPPEPPPWSFGPPVGPIMAGFGPSRLDPQGTRVFMFWSPLEPFKGVNREDSRGKVRDVRGSVWAQNVKL